MSGPESTELSLYTVDAFSSVPFSGNPAAVCLLKYGMTLDDSTLQSIAMEMNLSETAFIRPLNPAEDQKTGRRFGLRWFTPRHEIKLCGHATLASAAVLFFELSNPNEEITFETLSGDLVVRRHNETLCMDFPLGITEGKKPSNYEAVIKALGKIPEVQDVRWCPSLKYLLIRLKEGWSRSEFEKWQPDIGQLEKSVTGVIVVIATTKGTVDQGYLDGQGKAYDFVSRCFAPWSGVPEDPVTGSAQTVLAHYWSPSLGQKDLYTRQCSARGGEIDIQVRQENQRVILSGKATLVMRGTLRI